MLRSLLCALVLLALPALGLEARFPNLKAEDLNGRAVALPEDLPSDPALVIAAFKRSDQAAVDTWVRGMDLKGALDGQWIELPVIAPGFRVMKPIIDNGMRSGITETEDRARAITIFTNRDRFVARFGETRWDRIYVLVVRRDGSILHVEPGPYSAEGAARLRAAMTAP